MNIVNGSRANTALPATYYGYFGRNIVWGILESKGLWPC